MHKYLFILLGLFIITFPCFAQSVGLKYNFPSVYYSENGISEINEPLTLEGEKSKATPRIKLLEWATGTVCGIVTFYLLMPREDDPMEGLGTLMYVTLPLSILTPCAGIHAVGTLTNKEGNILYALIGQLFGVGLSILYLQGVPDNTRDKILNNYILAGTIICGTGSFIATIGYNWKWEWKPSVE